MAQKAANGKNYPSQVEAVKRYTAKNYDKKLVLFPKGGLDRLKALAEQNGESVNHYILEAIEQRSGVKFTLDG